MSDSRPVGILDSGLGGLIFARELGRLLPRESFYFLGDTARSPYGTKSEKRILNYTEQAIEFLLHKNVKVVVIAGATMTAIALEHVRATFKDVPIIGQIQAGAQAAVLRTAEKRIGVIGSTATIASGAFERAIHQIDQSIEVFGRQTPLLGALIEEGLQETDLARIVAQRYLYQLVDMGIDCLILGSTHYSLLLEVVQETVGSSVQLIDCTTWAVKELADLLNALDFMSKETKPALQRSICALTDVAPATLDAAGHYFGAPPPPLEVVSLEPHSSSIGS